MAAPVRQARAACLMLRNPPPVVLERVRPSKALSSVISAKNIALTRQRRLMLAARTSTAVVGIVPRHTGSLRSGRGFADSPTWPINASPPL
jgi:hypothetical protein